MNTALIAAACGLIAAVSWGISDFLAARASKAESAEATVLCVSLVSAVVYSLFFLLDRGANPWTAGGVGYGVAAGVFMGLGLMLFYRGLEAGPVSIVSPVGSAYPLVTTLLVLAVLGGHLSALQIIGILLIVAGIVGASGIFEVKKVERKLSAGVAYALSTFVMWGIAFALLGQAVMSLGWEKGTFVDIWLEFIAVAIALPLIKRDFRFRSLRLVSDKFIASAAVIQLLGLIIFNIGVAASASTAVITAISASYPALTAFLALKQFGEKQTLAALSGALVTIIGVIMLSVS